jgi:DNA-directed RNA polymerase specialized sigma subunit
MDTTTGELKRIRATLARQRLTHEHTLDRMNALAVKAIDEGMTQKRVATLLGLSSQRVCQIYKER